MAAGRSQCTRHRWLTASGHHGRKASTGADHGQDSKRGELLQWAHLLGHWGRLDWSRLDATLHVTHQP